VEGRRGRFTEPKERKMAKTPSFTTTSTKLQRIANQAKNAPQLTSPAQRVSFEVKLFICEGFFANECETTGVWQ
jgi:hypothetical protein